MSATEPCPNGNFPDDPMGHGWWEFGPYPWWRRLLRLPRVVTCAYCGARRPRTWTKA